MARRRPYTLLYTADVVSHFDAIPRRQHSLIRRHIEVQLRYEPGTETRNRKPLLRPSVLGEAWELRCGQQNRFRVFYRVDRVRRRVYVVAVGLKVGSRLFVGREEFVL
jgi:hypothetical protein